MMRIDVTFEEVFYDRQAWYLPRTTIKDSIFSESPMSKKEICDHIRRVHTTYGSGGGMWSWPDNITIMQIRSDK